MPLIDDVPAEKTLLGTLDAQTVFTCLKGGVALTTEDGAGQNYFPLTEGNSIVLSSELTVHYWDISPVGEVSALHYMAI
jgi:hypothetical protein